MFETMFRYTHNVVAQVRNQFKIYFNEFEINQFL